MKDNHTRFAPVVFAVFAGMLAIGISVASPLPGGSPDGLPKLAPVTIVPLEHTQPNQAQLDTCVTVAQAYAARSYPGTVGMPTVMLKKQQTGAQLGRNGPGGGKFSSILMNLVILKGHFRLPRTTAYASYLLMVLGPYPECYPTVISTDVSDFGLK